MFEAVHRVTAAKFWRGDEPSEVAGLLRQEGFELSMAFPLNAGGARGGAVLILGLPDEEHFNSVLVLLDSLSTIVALVLRRKPDADGSAAGTAPVPASQLQVQVLPVWQRNIEAARRLVALARRLGDRSALALAYERIVTLDPFDSATHSAFGRLAWEQRDVATAVREFQAAIDAGPVDPVPARCDLAEALMAAGQRTEAKQAVLAALEIAPTFERAQQLLLRIVGGK